MKKSLCSTVVYANSKLQIAHAKSVHKVSLEKSTTAVIMVENKNYLPPGEALCPKKRSSINDAKRQEAAEERRSRPVLGEVKAEGSNINRDEDLRMVETNIEGQSVIQFKHVPKPLWKPKKVQK